MIRLNNLISVVSIAGLAFLGATAHAQYLEDGDMDDLDPGTNPDIGDPAGAWSFPANYCTDGVCEGAASQFTIVRTDSFDPDAAGNSLRMHIADEPDHHRHLPNRFVRVIHESDQVQVVAQFDLWVADEPDVGGGTVYLSGDHGGGGYSRLTDRSAQVTWWPNGDLTAADDFEQVFLLDHDFPRAEWQTVRFVIDLESDTYSVKWARRGDPFETVAENLAFRSGNLNHLDRISLAHIGLVGPTTTAYLDNVSVRTGPEAPNLTIIGECPGRMEFLITDATPDSRVALLYARGEGSVEIPPGYLCAGTALGLDSTTKLARIIRVDANGEAQFAARVPARACGRVFVQAIDLAACATSNVQPVE